MKPITKIGESLREARAAPSEVSAGGTPRKVRSLFLSDIHLGSRACRSEQLLSFLKDYDAQYLFLLGDIIDFWAMSRSLYWPAQHNTVIQKILKKSRHGVKVVLVPGNHDEALREYIGYAFGDIAVARDYVYTALDGKRYALLHGDEYDHVTTYHRWLSVLGDVSYTLLVHMNRALSWARRKMGISGHWSLADYMKRNVLRAVSFISDFENAVVHDVRERGMDGVICGHIHTPVIKSIDGTTYMNCGDWVDNCTAILETYDGQMMLVQWVDSHPAELSSAEESLISTPAGRWSADARIVCNCPPSLPLPAQPS
jgi:UDP-2,3-diacylglucosamine pyrophosphatase LpxH